MEVIATSPSKYPHSEMRPLDGGYFMRIALSDLLRAIRRNEVRELVQGVVETKWEEISAAWEFRESPAFKAIVIDDLLRSVLEQVAHTLKEKQGASAALGVYVPKYEQATKMDFAVQPTCWTGEKGPAN